MFVRNLAYLGLSARTEPTVHCCLCECSNT